MRREIERIERVLEQARRELDGLSEQLAVTTAQLRQAEQQLADLKQYARQLERSDAGQTLRGDTFQRRRGYFGQLLHAVEQIGQQITGLNDRRQEVEQAWLAQRARVKALEKLLNRRREQLRLQDEKKAQRMLDERAAWQWHVARDGRP